MVYTYQDIPVYISATGNINTGIFLPRGVPNDLVSAQSVSVNFDRSVEPKKIWGDSGSYEYLHSGPSRGTIQINSFYGYPYSVNSDAHIGTLETGGVLVKVGSLDFSGVITSYSLSINPWEMPTETWNIQFFSGGGAMEAGPLLTGASTNGANALQVIPTYAGGQRVNKSGNLPNIIGDVKFTDTRNIIERYPLGAVYPQWSTSSRTKRADITSDNITGLVTWSGEEAQLEIGREIFFQQGGTTGQRYDDAGGPQGGFGANNPLFSVSGYIKDQDLSVSEQGLLEGNMTIEEVII